MRSFRLRSLAPPRWIAALAVLLVAPAAVTVLRFPVLVMEPGPAPDVAAKSDIRAATYESSGSFHLTTVQIRRPDGSTVYEMVGALLTPDRYLVSRASVYPPGGSDEQADQVQSAQMVQSEVSAAAAAFRALGIEYELDGALVVDVRPDSPVAGVLRPGDLITEVDSESVRSVNELSEAIGSRLVGETVALTVERGSETTTEKVRTIASEDKPPRTIIGVEVSQHHRAPIEINFDAADIGGPSAGLMFALSIYDRLSEEDLTAGRIIAGTGTIDDLDGRSVVGGVGAVELKVRGAMRIGADLFFVPEESVDEAREVAGSSMEVIGVSTFEEAVSALRDFPARA